MPSANGYLSGCTPRWTACIMLKRSACGCVVLCVACSCAACSQPYHPSATVCPAGIKECSGVTQAPSMTRGDMRIRLLYIYTSHALEEDAL